MSGFTVKAYGLAATPVMVTGVVPSVYVKSHGCAPVKLTLKFAVPEQRLPPPVKVACVIQVHVGSKAGFTVTMADPEFVPAQAASATLVSV